MFHILVLLCWFINAHLHWLMTSCSFCFSLDIYLFDVGVADLTSLCFEFTSVFFGLREVQQQQLGKYIHCRGNNMEPFRKVGVFDLILHFCKPDTKMQTFMVVLTMYRNVIYFSWFCCTGHCVRVADILLTLKIESIDTVIHNLQS